MSKNIIDKGFVMSEMIPTSTDDENYRFRYSFVTQSRLADWTTQQLHDYTTIGYGLLKESSKREEYGLFEERLKQFQQGIDADLARGETLEDLTDD
jgi:hypothetical protein